MKKIIIIGNAGAGKTTFATKLALKLNIPLIHLDKLYWYGEWQHLSKQDMGGMCIERFDSNKITLYRNVLKFKKEHRKEYYDLLNQSTDVQIIVFKNRRQVRRFLNVSCGEND